MYIIIIKPKRIWELTFLFHFLHQNPDKPNRSDEDMPLHVQPLTSLWLSPLVWVCLAITSAMAVSLGLFLACSSTQKTEHDTESLSSPAGPGYSSNAYNVDNLKLCAMIGQGKYGTVWKGIVNDKPVAVKIFPAQHKQYFVNERNIYSMSLMDSPSLLEYFGKQWPLSPALLKITRCVSKSASLFSFHLW